MKFSVKLPGMSGPRADKAQEGSITRGTVPMEAGRGLLRRLRGYALWGSVSFAFFLVFAWLCLPTRAIAWRIGHEARRAGYIVDVKDVSVNLLGDITIEQVTWTFAPSRPDTPPSKFMLYDVTIDVSWLWLLIGNIDVDIEAHPADGRIFAHYDRDSSSSAVKIEIEELPLYDVPKARQALNAPLHGLFGLKVDLEMPGNKFAKASGTIDLTCAGCTIGDGETKLYIPGSKGLKDGTVIPQIDLGTFVGKMIVDKGVAKTEGLMETKSDDVEVSVEGEIDFNDPFPKSRFDMTVKVNLTQALQQRSEKLRLVFQGADLKARLDPPEQGLGYVLSGPVGNPKFKGIKSKSTSRDSRAEKRAKQRARDEKKKPTKPREPTGPLAKPALPGGPVPPMPPLDPAAATGPTTTVPAPNGVDVQNVPLPGGSPTAPAAGQPVPPPPPTPLPPVEPAPEPDPVIEEPQVEPPPPEDPEEVPTILPPDGSFGGSGGPIGEPPQ